MTSAISMKFILKFCLLIGLISALTDCQSKPIKDFEKITLGHDKSDVIEFIGGPTWSDRRDGFDRWNYIIFQDGVRLEREIRFYEGIVAYIGEPIKPFISAVEQDAINAEKNLYLDRIDRKNTSQDSSSYENFSPLKRKTFEPNTSK